MGLSYLFPCKSSKFFPYFPDVWDASTGVELEVLKGHTGLVNSVAFSSDCMWIVSGSNDYSVWVWDALTGVKLKVLKGHTGC